MSSVLALSCDSGFNAYMQKVLAIPVLQEDEERELIDRWYTSKDLSAAQRLVEAYLRLVGKVVMKFRNYGLPLMDLVSEGNIGLMKAIKNFKPELGYKIATYAVWWIKAAIHEYVIKSWSLVKIGTTAAQRKLFFNLRKLKNAITNADNGMTEAQVATQISQTLDVKLQDVVEMDAILNARDISLSTPVTEGETKEMHEIIEAGEDSQEVALIAHQERSIRQKLLKEAIDLLDERQKKIFILRTASEHSTLKEISKMFDISQERVRQIHARALEKIKMYIVQAQEKLGIKLT
jgi:RNA polymerase sigma-32 factor